MPSCIAGQTAPFSVTCFNGATPPAPIPDTGRTITVVPQGGSVASVTCNADGSGGVFTASSVPGQGKFLASDGQILSDIFTFDVIPDPSVTPTTLVITSP